MAEPVDLDALVKLIEEGNKDSSELDRLTAAVELNKHLADLGDQLISNYVAGARAAGRSWAEIGATLGVSKQGAQQRFTGRFIPAQMRREIRKMYRESKLGFFERFNDSARRVVVEAQVEARRLNHNYLGTEHILLGLLAEGGRASELLKIQDVSLVDVREKIEEVIGRGTEEAVGPPAFTPRAKKVLELGLREALQLGHDYVSTEHLLLGLVREGGGVAAQILQKLDVVEDEIRTAVQPRRGGEPAGG